MAQVTFDVANEMESARQQSSGNSFDFFTLRNDGDEAIVRFRYQNTSQFKIFTVHDVELVNNGRKRAVERLTVCVSLVIRLICVRCVRQVSILVTLSLLR